MRANLNHTKLGDLEALDICGAGYRAVVLLQGAQLIQFFTDIDTNANVDSDGDGDGDGDGDIRTIDIANNTNNWLWHSEQAVYKRGVSVRGGVPICWPIFGMFDANPPQVQQSFANCQQDVSKHGYARTQHFELDNFEPALIDNKLGEVSRLTLTLPYNLLSYNKQSSDKHASNKQSANKQQLQLKAVFIFNRLGFSISLITHNNSPDTIHYTQALHSYLPTDDISNTSITGFDDVSYTDTLKDWIEVIQNGDITFQGEVDRIYHYAPTIYLNTPRYRYQLTSSGSHSTVVWNPWQDKAQELSQFCEDDYKRMLCIETANAHLDSVSLAAGSTHHLSMTLQRQKIDA